MKNLRLFSTENEYSTAILNYPSVSFTQDEQKVHFDASAIKFVDLGLTSGTKWMKCNVGAEKETDYGLYFQWGATQGYAYDSDEAKTNSYWSTCPGNGGNDSYDSEAFATWKATNLTDGVLNTSVDAAYQATNGKAKIPTYEQQLELLKETDIYLVFADGTEVHGTFKESYIEWDTEVSGKATISGCKFFNKNDSSKYIFIPAAGGVVVGEFNGVGSYGVVWSGSLYSSGERAAYGLVFISGGAYVSGNGRYDGLPVRGVSVG